MKRDSFYLIIFSIFLFLNFKITVIIRGYRGVECRRGM